MTDFSCKKEDLRKILEDFIYNIYLHNPPNLPPQNDLIENDFNTAIEKIMEV